MITELAQAVVDGLVQGITEYLPISSSAHLYLAQLWMDVVEDPLSRIVIVHLGTLFGASWAMRRHLLGWLGGIATASAWTSGHPGKLAHVAVASLPVLVIGGLFNSVVADLYSVPVIVAATLFFGLLLAAFWRWGRADRDWDSIGFADAIIAGMAQVLALIPGTSRSGICMTALLGRGFHPAVATRFSVLMALPVLSAAVVWLGWRWANSPEFFQPLADIVAGAVAMAGSWAVVRFGLPYLERSPQGVLLWACIAWRMVLGCLLLLALWQGWLS